MGRLFLVLAALAACSAHQNRGNGPDASGGGDDGNTTTQCNPSQAMACNGNDVVACNADGTFGTTVMTCGNGQMCSNGACSNVCTADGVDLVYVVDEQNHFMSFDPRKLPGDPFSLIGTLTCPTTGGSIQ